MLDSTDLMLLVSALLSQSSIGPVSFMSSGAGAVGSGTDGAFNASLRQHDAVYNSSPLILVSFFPLPASYSPPVSISAA